MPCAHPDPEKLKPLLKEGIIAEYDISVKEREKHDREMKRKRENRVRKKVTLPSLHLTLPFRYACSHPKTKLVQKQTYTRKFEIIPPCPYCHENASLEYETFYLTNQYGAKTKLVETYRCRKCQRSLSPWKYKQLKNKTWMACSAKIGNQQKKCGGKVKPQKTYPWIFECTKCHEVYPPERKEELLNVKIEHRAQNLIEYKIPHGDITRPEIRKIKTEEYQDTFVSPEEDIIDGDLYQCPIYGGVKRVRWNKFCKELCGFRSKKEK